MYRYSSESSITREENAILLLHNLQNSAGYKLVQQKRSVSNSKNGLCTSVSYSTLKESSVNRQLNRSIHSRILLTEDGSMRNVLDTHGSFNKQSQSIQGEDFGQDLNMSSLRNNSQSTKRLRSISKNKTLADSLVYCQDAMGALEKYGDSLNLLFTSYATCGEPNNTTKLKSIKFHKLLRDAQIMQNVNSISSNPVSQTNRSRDSVASGSGFRKYLNPIEVDLIFVQLTGSKFRKEVNRRASKDYQSNIKTPVINAPSYMSQKSLKDKQIEGKLEFESFLKAIELVAEKAYPNKQLPQAVESIIKRLLRLLPSIDYEQKVAGLHHIACLKDILTNEEYVRLMGVVHENIEVYFGYYSDAKRHMNFQQFCRFFKDFEVFPKRISQKKLSNYFYTLASLNVRLSNGRSSSATTRAILTRPMPP
jgi:hypothetical protein